MGLQKLIGNNGAFLNWRCFLKQNILMKINTFTLYIIRPDEGTVTSKTFGDS